MSTAFDRIGACYDEMSPLPAHVVTALTEAIIAAVQGTPGPRFLDVGVGTGRITIPIAQRGYQCVGLDLSSGMMQRLRSKDSQGLVRLVRGDMTCLPFAGGSFDAVMAVHVFHLVADWRRALAEARRVLVAGGVVLHTLPDKPGSSITGMAREQWQRFVRELGGNPNHAGARSAADVHAALVQMGAEVREVDVVSWTASFSPRDMLARADKHTPSPPDQASAGIFDIANGHYRAWLLDRFGSLDCRLEEERQAILTIARFP